MADDKDDHLTLALELFHTEALTTSALHRNVGNVVEELRSNEKTLLLEVSRSADVKKILDIEQALLQKELTLVASSPAMTSSLNTAIKELDAALKLLEKVKSPNTYQELAAAYTLDKNQIRGLPRDEARQFFKSHQVRLRNLDKGRLSDSERNVLSTRLYNIKSAERLYEQLQEQALGIKAERNRGKGPDLGR